MHSIIHLVGFIKSFDLIELSHLTKTISKPLGILWLSTALLFFICLYAVWMGHLWWWMVAIVAAILSQILILQDWNEANYGTIANVIILVAATVGFGQWNLTNQADEKILLLEDSTETHFQTQSMDSLPPIVQQWIKRSNILEKEPLKTVRIHQSGELKTSPEGKWMAVKSTQWINPEKPAFVWKARVSTFLGTHLAGLDSYVQGEGKMKILWMSLIPVVTAEGPEIDQGSLVRYLGELVWLPSAAMLSFISWEEIDDLSARATIHYAGSSEEAVFTFDENGDFLSFQALRYFENEGKSSLEEWIIEVAPGGYGEFNGVRVPTHLSISWNLEDGLFTWFNLRVDEVEYIN